MIKPYMVSSVQKSVPAVLTRVVYILYQERQVIHSV
jgi:hypothetical protein